MPHRLNAVEITQQEAAPEIQPKPNLKVTAIITAAGQGRRMGLKDNENKLFLPLKNRPILEHSILAVTSVKSVDSLIITTPSGQESQAEDLLSELKLDLFWTVTAGGTERQHSIANALKLVPKDADIILVHDGARPLAKPELIAKVIEAAGEYQAALLAVRVKDTIKEASPDGFVVNTPDRDKLWAVQTPQAFKAGLLLKAYDDANLSGYLGTDDASLVERLGVKVKIIAGDYQNIKITTAEDIALAESFLPETPKPSYSASAGAGCVRVGIGYDVHQLVTGRKLIIGGVEIPYTHGLEGHSDADVLLHAVKDALLGAAALGDIGAHFPDSEPAYKGVSSIELLKKVKSILDSVNFKVVNVDATVVAQKPKLASYITIMRQNIAEALDSDILSINVKATTTEGLGFAGRCEGIAAYATVSIVKV